MNLQGKPAADRAARIRELNDAFRKTFTGGKVVMTASVAELPGHGESHRAA